MRKVDMWIDPDWVIGLRALPWKPGIVASLLESYDVVDRVEDKFNACRLLQLAVSRWESRFSGVLAVNWSEADVGRPMQAELDFYDWCRNFVASIQSRRAA